MKDVLIILGSHPRGAETFDFNRTDCDIWVFNEALAIQPHIKKADAVFQMHAEAIWRNPHNRNDSNHAAWLKSGETPLIYMQDVYPDVPKSVRYPLQDICQALLPAFSWHGIDKQGDKYFSSTFCYALALGIHQGYKTIEVHGAEMETDTEYKYQRDGVTFWLGIAIGRGVKVKAYTKIFDFPLYGYEGEATLHLSDFEKRIDELKPLIEEQRTRYKDITLYATQTLDEFLKTGKKYQETMDALKAQVTAGYEINKLAGAMQENEKYIAKAKAMTEHAGEFQFSRQEFEGALMGTANEHDKAINAATTSAGACNALFNKAIQAKNYVKRKRAVDEFLQVARQYLTASCYVGLYNGAASENSAYLAKLDKLIKAAGGSKSEAVLLNV
jgi:hypothetical protein